MSDCLRVSKVSWKFRIPFIYNFALYLQYKFAIFLKSRLLLTVSIVFSVYINKTLQLNDLKPTTAMNAKILLFVLKRSYSCYYVISRTAPLTLVSCLLSTKLSLVDKD